MIRLIVRHLHIYCHETSLCWRAGCDWWTACGPLCRPLLSDEVGQRYGSLMKLMNTAQTDGMCVWEDVWLSDIPYLLCLAVCLCVWEWVCVCVCVSTYCMYTHTTCCTHTLHTVHRHRHTTYSMYWHTHTIIFAKITASSIYQSGVIPLIMDCLSHGLMFVDMSSKHWPVRRRDLQSTNQSTALWNLTEPLHFETWHLPHLDIHLNLEIRVVFLSRPLRGGLSGPWGLGSAGSAWASGRRSSTTEQGWLWTSVSYSPVWVVFTRHACNLTLRQRGKLVSPSLSLFVLHLNCGRLLDSFIERDLQ